MSTFVCALDKDYIEDAMKFSTREEAEEYGRSEARLWNKDHNYPVEDTFGYIDDDVESIDSFVVAQLVQPIVNVRAMTEVAIENAQEQVEAEDPEDYSDGWFGEREVKSLEKHIQAWLEDTGLIDFPYFEIQDVRGVGV